MTKYIEFSNDEIVKQIKGEKKLVQLFSIFKLGYI